MLFRDVKVEVCRGKRRQDDMCKRDKRQLCCAKASCLSADFGPIKSIFPFRSLFFSCWSLVPKHGVWGLNTSKSSPRIPGRVRVGGAGEGESLLSFIYVRVSLLYLIIWLGLG